jgi:hypothetical protein
MPYHEIWKRMDNNLCVHKLVYGGLDMEYIYMETTTTCNVLKVLWTDLHATS